MAIMIRPPSRVKKRKSQSAEEALQRLQGFLDNNSEEPVKFLCGFWKDQQNAISYQEIREAVKSGAMNEAVFRDWSHDYSVLVQSKLKPMWEKAMETASMMEPVLQEKAFQFNTQAPGVLHWISKRGAEFVTSSTMEQRKAIQSLLAHKVTQQYTVDELAKYIRPCIGLTEGQAKANQKYYDNIVSTLTKDHPRMKKESIEKKAREAAAKYAEKQHRYRAMTIAQTELAFAYNRGEYESILQAQAQGILGKVKKHWNTSGDDQVCDICRGLDGVELDMDKDFDYKGRVLFPGHKLLPPAHPRCACAIEYIEVEPPAFNDVPASESMVLDTVDILLPDSAEGTYSVDAGGEEILGQNEPKYLGSLDNLSDNVVRLTLEKYESEIVEYDQESAIVVTAAGLIFQCFGTKNSVSLIEDMGEELEGASVTHNHPVGSGNEYSFSNDDINVFMDYNLKMLRGIDEKYVYELSRNENEVDRHATMEELLGSDGDLSRHDDVIRYAETWGIGYRRWKR